VTVLDFGLAKRLGSGSGTMPNLVMGTPGFMAPEQIRGQEVTARTDLYALGVVAWVLLTGQEPFSAPSIMELMMAHLEQPLPSLTPLAPGCPPALIKLVERLLAKQPADRPQSALEVLTELQHIRHERASRPPALVAAPKPKPSAPRPAARRVEPTLIVDRKAKASPSETSQELPPRRGPYLALGSVVALVLISAVAWQLARTPAQPDIETRPTTTDVKPTDVKPTDVKPTDVKPSDTKPTDVKPSDVKPSDMKPSDMKPTDVKPTDVKPTDVKPTDTMPSDTMPSDTKPTDVKPSDVKPTKDVKATGATVASVEKRLASARSKAAKLGNAAARRMMTLDLDGLEKRLLGGEAPRTVNRDLGEVLENYGVP
jgi:serine/threonine protein kinase